MRGSVELGGAGSFAGTGPCARSMETKGARRRATAMRRIFIRARSRKEAEMKLPDCDAQRHDWTGESLCCAPVGSVKEPVVQVVRQFQFVLVVGQFQFVLKGRGFSRAATAHESLGTS